MARAAWARTAGRHRVADQELAVRHSHGSALRRGQGCRRSRAEVAGGTKAAVRTAVAVHTKTVVHREAAVHKAAAVRTKAADHRKVAARTEAAVRMKAASRTMIAAEGAGGCKHHGRRIGRRIGPEDCLVEDSLDQRNGKLVGSNKRNVVRQTKQQDVVGKEDIPWLAYCWSLPPSRSLVVRFSKSLRSFLRNDILLAACTLGKDREECEKEDLPLLKS